MPETGLILTLAAGLGAALLCGYVTQRLGLSPIVGYLVAGVILGPYTPGYTADAHLAEQFAEVGVILLMFGVGLQFHVDELLAVRRVAIPGAVLQSLVATVLGALAGRMFGWTWPAAIVLGLSLSVASTVVLVRVLSDSRQLHTGAGHIAVGWLVVEDIFTVVVLVMLPALAGTPSLQGLGMSLGLTVVKVVGLGLVAAVVGDRVIPIILDRVAAMRSRELFTLAVLALALGLAVGASLVFGVSIALDLLEIGLQPAEVRVADTGAVGSLARAVLATSLGTPLRLIECQSPAASGAALVAAVCLGHYRDLVDGFAEWVEPRLSQIRPIEQAPEPGRAPGKPAPAPV